MTESDLRVRVDGRLLVVTVSEITDDAVLHDRAVDALEEEFGDDLDIDSKS